MSHSYKKSDLNRAGKKKGSGSNNGMQGQGGSGGTRGNSFISDMLGLSPGSSSTGKNPAPSMTGPLTGDTLTPGGNQSIVEQMAESSRPEVLDGDTLTPGGNESIMEQIGQMGTGLREFGSEVADNIEAVGNLLGIGTPDPLPGDAELTEEQWERHLILEAASYASYLNQDEVAAWNAQNSGARAAPGDHAVSEEEQAELEARTTAMEILYRAGYEVNIRHGEEGLAYAEIVDANTDDDTDLAPILAFRGTELGRGGETTRRDLDSDADTEDGVGYGQFENENNQAMIQRSVQRLQEEHGGAESGMSITGHSLGGSLAQRAHARFADSANVAETVTFNRGGTSDEVVEEFEGLNSRAPVHHHIVNSVLGGRDIVHTAGPSLAGIEHRHSWASSGGLLQGQTHCETPLKDRGAYETDSRWTSGRQHPLERLGHQIFGGVHDYFTNTEPDSSYRMWLPED